MHIKKDPNGYIRVYVPSHHRATPSGYVYQHLLVAESSVGHALPLKASIHHRNENKHDNRPCNLVVCENEAYHQLLHQRLDAFRACGNPNWLQCHYCSIHDDPSRMYVYKKKNAGFHRACQAEYKRRPEVRLRRPSRAKHARVGSSHGY